MTFGSANVAEALANTGFDWLVVDMEHGASDVTAVADQLRAIDAAGARGSRTSAAVRVSSRDAAQVQRVMDAGAETVIFPKIETADEARAAVNAMRFPQGANGGLRGVAGMVRAGSFGLDAHYLLTANARACTIVQIESLQALQNSEYIAAVTGVDCLFIGPADLSASLGHLGNVNHPEVQLAIGAIIRAAHKFGKAVGIYAADAESAAAYRAAGVACIALHSDVNWLTAGAIDARVAFADRLSVSAPEAIESAGVEQVPAAQNQQSTYGA
nr:aldolase/citrate lyase family protein [Lysinibacter cavernae]